MKKMISMVISVLVLISASGCSTLVYRDSYKKVYARKAILSNNERAIRAVQLGDGGVGLGIDLANLEVLTEQPFLQLGAAALDAAALYGAYEGIRSITSNNSNKENENNTTGNGNSTVNVESGDNSPVIINTHNGDDNAAKP